MKKKTLDLKSIAKRIAGFFTHNWQWKLLSLFLAVALWSGLITQDETLSREKIFNDVVINVTNADTLRRNGFIDIDIFGDRTFDAPEARAARIHIAAVRE